MIDIDIGVYVDINGDVIIVAVSMIKLFILVVFFQVVDQGRIKLDDMLIMKEYYVVKGFGDMQFCNFGS